MSAISLTKSNPSTITTPNSIDKVFVFIDENGILKYKDSDGIIKSFVDGPISASQKFSTSSSSPYANVFNTGTLSVNSCFYVNTKIDMCGITSNINGSLMYKAVIELDLSCILGVTTLLNSNVVASEINSATSYSNADVDLVYNAPNLKLWVNPSSIGSDMIKWSTITIINKIDWSL